MTDIVNVQLPENFHPEVPQDRINLMGSLATYLEYKLNFSQELFNDFSYMMENLLELGYVYDHLQILMHKVASTSQN